MLNRWWALLFLLSATLTHAVQPSAKPQESFAPYWTSEPGWATELQLKNNLSSKPLVVTPVLRLASGQEIPLDATTIPPNSSVSVWVNEGLLAHSPDHLSQPGSFGSVVFRFTSLSALNLHATVVLAIQGEPISVPIQAHPAWHALNTPRAYAPGSLEGIWWQPSAGLNDVLVLGNHSDKKISGTLSLYDSAGKRWSQPLALDARQTQRLGTSDLLHKAGLTGNFGGISLDLPAPAVDAVHFMYNEVSKFSASLELFTRDPNATLRQRAGSDAKYWTMWAPMLALRSPDPALNAPRGILLQPTIFVRNTTAKSIAAELALNWRGDSGKGRVKLPALQLAPFASQQLQIGSMQKQLGIPDDAHWALVALTTTASPDDLVAVATSIDSSGRYNLDTRFAGGVGGHFAGGEWRADANRNVIAAITNIGSKPTNALLTLHYDNGQKSYEMQQTIQPGNQMWVNIAELIHDRVPDRKGNTLPVDLTSVTYDLRDLTPGGHGLMANALAADTSYGFHTIPPYANCCGYDDIGFDPDVFDLFVGESDSAWIYGTDECDDDVENLDPDFNAWGSDNSSIVQMTSGKATGVAAGSTYGFGNGDVLTGEGSYCAYDPEQPTAEITVQPTITSFDPNPIMIGSTNGTLTINGTGFGAEPSVNLPAGITSTGQGSTETQIVLQGVSVAFTAKIGSNNVTVTASGATSSPASLGINGPNKMVVQNDRIGPTSNDPAGQSRYVTYTVTNYDGTSAANIPIAENWNPSGYNCQQQNPGNRTAQCNAQYSTDGSGGVTDEWAMYTGYTPAGCGQNVTDHWQWCGPAGSNPNPGITFGTLVGWVHSASTDINTYINPPTTIPQGTVFGP